MKNSKNKKGFTLIELIAVIAILGILAVIIVPNIANKTTMAEEAKNKANLKTIAQAVEIYNTENTTALITNDTTLDTIKGYLIPTEAGKAKYLSSWPTKLGATLTLESKYSDLLELLKEK